MSKRKAIILSVVVEGCSQADTARRFEVSQAWVSILVARYRNEGAAAFQAGSRRPHRSPQRIDEPAINRIIELRDDLSAKGSRTTTTRCPVGVNNPPLPDRINPEPAKRSKSSYTRFEASLPNEMWQTDMCHWRLANGAGTEILSWLDDNSRYALRVSQHRSVNAAIVVDAFQQAAKTHGYPASVLSDNAASTPPAKSHSATKATSTKSASDEHTNTNPSSL